ncbi:hypothetical protein AB5A11_002155 [Vibrio cholerae]|uniref:hypothetical protein n=1 Tax=Vibrio TaxID=662 RepID=UPI001B38308A|nr:MULTISPECIES: hypothetical protein [Vibrio]MBP8547624.1 hypothetical protein [Vibrio paracholerae]MEB5520106.1 hypothetical protein [Vibrio cholerae]
MKSVLYGMIISCPITAIIIYFALSGRQEVLIQQKTHEVQQQIRSEEFQRNFSKAWTEFDRLNQHDKAALSVDDAERDERIKKLKKLRSQLEASDSHSMDSLEADLAEMRKALKEAEQRNNTK